MKLRHLILFFIACIVLMLSHLPGAALIALFTWLQIYALFTQKVFNKKVQLWAASLFLISVPLALFWSSIHEFLFIYFNEQAWVFFLMAFILDFCLCLLATIYFILAFQVAESSQYQLLPSLKAAIQQIRLDQKDYFLKSALLFLISLIPFFASDWKIIFTITATHLFLNRNRLKPVYESGF